MAWSWEAALEATLALATILRDVAIRTPAGPVALSPQITLHPAGPVPAQLSLAANAARAGDTAAR